ncbi:MAG: hypothetical protein IKZ49_02320 [Alphaproteobacteria bacterium]|nr:hypothetical protein [Alphaproteobacteria bacterium]
MTTFYCKIGNVLIAPNVYNGFAITTKECVNFSTQNKNICNQCVLCFRDAIQLQK